MIRNKLIIDLVFIEKQFIHSNYERAYIDYFQKYHYLFNYILKLTFKDGTDILNELKELLTVHF